MCSALLSGSAALVEERSDPTLDISTDAAVSVARCGLAVTFSSL